MSSETSGYLPAVEAAEISTSSLFHTVFGECTSDELLDSLDFGTKAGPNWMQGAFDVRDLAYAGMLDKVDKQISNGSLSAIPKMAAWSFLEKGIVVTRLDSLDSLDVYVFLWKGNFRCAYYSERTKECSELFRLRSFFQSSTILILRDINRYVELERRDFGSKESTFFVDSVVRRFGISMSDSIASYIAGIGGDSGFAIEGKCYREKGIHDSCSSCCLTFDGSNIVCEESSSCSYHSNFYKLVHQPGDVAAEFGFTFREQNVKLVDKFVAVFSSARVSPEVANFSFLCGFCENVHNSHNLWTKHSPINSIVRLFTASIEGGHICVDMLVSFLKLLGTIPSSRRWQVASTSNLVVAKLLRGFKSDCLCLQIMDIQASVLAAGKVLSSHDVLYSVCLSSFPYARVAMTRPHRFIEENKAKLASIYWAIVSLLSSHVEKASSFACSVMAWSEFAFQDFTFSEVFEEILESFIEVLSSTINLLPVRRLKTISSSTNIGVVLDFLVATDVLSIGVCDIYGYCRVPRESTRVVKYAVCIIQELISLGVLERTFARKDTRRFEQISEIEERTVGKLSETERQKLLEEVFAELRDCDLDIELGEDDGSAGDAVGLGGFADIEDPLENISYDDLLARVNQGLSTFGSRGQNLADAEEDAENYLCVDADIQHRIDFYGTREAK